MTTTALKTKTTTEAPAAEKSMYDWGAEHPNDTVRAIISLALSSYDGELREAHATKGDIERIIDMILDEYEHSDNGFDIVEMAFQVVVRVGTHGKASELTEDDVSAAADDATNK